ncbi:MAG: hypothetical protein ACRDHN_17525 [Thermomicrobiales bacterium]
MRDAFGRIWHVLMRQTPIVTLSLSPGQVNYLDHQNVLIRKSLLWLEHLALHASIIETRINQMPAIDTAAPGEFLTVGYMRMTTFIMLIIGVFMVVAGIFSDIGAFGIVFGLLMIVSAVIKVVALRIIKSTIVESPRVEAEER